MCNAKMVVPEDQKVIPLAFDCPARTQIRCFLRTFCLHTHPPSNYPACLRKEESQGRHMRPEDPSSGDCFAAPGEALPALRLPRIPCNLSTEASMPLQNHIYVE